MLHGSYDIKQKKKKEFSAAQWDTCSPFGFALCFCFFGSSFHLGKQSCCKVKLLFFFFPVPCVYYAKTDYVFVEYTTSVTFSVRISLSLKLWFWLRLLLYFCNLESWWIKLSCRNPISHFVLVERSKLLFSVR